MGLVLVTLLTVTLLTSSRTSHPSPENIADVQMVLYQEGEGAVLRSLAYASNQTDVSVAFSQRLRQALLKVEGSHFGISLSPLVSQASKSDGIVSAQGEVQFGWERGDVSRKLVYQVELEQKVTKVEVFSGLSPQLVYIQLRVDLTLKKSQLPSPAVWRNSKIVYSSGEVACSLVKNFGNGTYLLGASLLAGETTIDLVTFDSNNIQVASRVVLP